MSTRRRIGWGVVVCGLTLGCGACGDTPAPTTPSGRAALVVTSSVMTESGQLPAEYTCDGAGVSPPLSWTGAPAGTAEFAVLMSTLPGDGTTKWNWVLYAVPAGVSALTRAESRVGIFGVGSDGPQAAYQPPCSQGPGAKAYTFTVYALSRALTPGTAPVTGAAVTAAVASTTLASGTLRVSYTRPRL